MNKLKHKNSRRKQRGQGVIEAILVMFLFTGLATAMMTGLKDKGILGKLVSGPWERVAGMMATGHWEPLSTARASGKLPHQRATSREGDSL